MDWRIYERDVDVTLAQEFYSNPEFACEVLRRTKFSSHLSAKVVQVNLSLSEALGESDLVIIFEREDSSRIAVLIEDKIDAIFQPDQFERYRERGISGVRDGRWVEFDIMLCAPSAYVQSHVDAAKFQSCFPYEDIATFLENHVGGQRGVFLSQFFRSAAPRGASAYVKYKDAPTDLFWEAAFQLAHAEFPELEMKRPDVARNASWINFRPRDFPPTVYVAMKAKLGFADLTFAKCDVARLDSATSAIDLGGRTLHQTGKSAAIRATFAPFSVSDGLDVVQSRVRTAFVCCRDLILLYRTHRGALKFIDPDLFASTADRFVWRDGDVAIEPPD